MQERPLIEVEGHAPARIGQRIFWKDRWIVVLTIDDWLHRWGYVELAKNETTCLTKTPRL